MRCRSDQQAHHQADQREAIGADALQDVITMGFKFQKRIRIFRGLTLNLSKSVSSWPVRCPGASVNFRGDKVTANTGIDTSST